MSQRRRRAGRNSRRLQRHQGGDAKPERSGKDRCRDQASGLREGLTPGFEFRVPGFESRDSQLETLNSELETKLIKCPICFSLSFSGDEVFLGESATS